MGLLISMIAANSTGDSGANTCVYSTSFPQLTLHDSILTVRMIVGITFNHDRLSVLRLCQSRSRPP
uniref:AC4 protein n=1 Tax=Tomato leaf curl New Delhi virus TaxID=223347 RepID=A7U6C8_9GEMI|nr:AC4 protein [Tomato leaf curl New Delhi virus]